MVKIIGTGKQGILVEKQFTKYHQTRLQNINLNINVSLVKATVFEHDKILFLALKITYGCASKPNTTVVYGG